MTNIEKRTGLVAKFQEGPAGGFLGLASQPQGIPGRVHTLLLGGLDLLFDTLNILLVLLAGRLGTTIAGGEAIYSLGRERREPVSSCRREESDSSHCV
jgi:hypothetical protein